MPVSVLLVHCSYKLAEGDLNDDIARLKATSKYRLAASYTSAAQVMGGCHWITSAA